MILKKLRKIQVHLIFRIRFSSVCFISSSVCVSAHFRLDALTDKKKVVQMMVRPNSGLDIKNRTWLKIPIPMSFLGKIFPPKKLLEMYHFVC